MLLTCQENHLASLARGPLAMGLLSGKYTLRDQIELQDIRQSQLSWNYFNGERMPGLLRQLDAVREILTSDGRTLVQGALGWLWARSSQIIPIPGFKTVKQVEENVKAMRFGPLSEQQMAEIEKLLLAHRA